MHAKTIGIWSCNSMYKNCSSLTKAPALTTENIAEGCYYGMFAGCTSLEEAPTLPIKVLAPSCYWEMFKDCSSLRFVPILPAETLCLCFQVVQI